MSSTICSDKIPVGSVSNDRCFAVNRQQPEGLADYVRRVRGEKGFSLLDVQRNSRGQIAGSYVSRIENGVADAEGVTPKKLQALAHGLQVPEDEIFAVARGKSLNANQQLDSELEQLNRYFSEVPRECQLDILA